MPLQRRMYGTALKMGIPPDDAADIVQETQVKLWRRCDGIPKEEKECGLYCMASFRNDCLTYLRRRRPTVELEEVAEQGGPDKDDIENRDTLQRVEKLIETLPKGQREAIKLSGFGGLEINEIAEATGQTEGNVRQLLSRGRRRLRELLKING